MVKEVPTESNIMVCKESWMTNVAEITTQNKEQHFSELSGIGFKNNSGSQRLLQSQLLTLSNC